MKRSAIFGLLAFAFFSALLLFPQEGLAQSYILKWLLSVRKPESVLKDTIPNNNFQLKSIDVELRTDPNAVSPAHDGLLNRCGLGYREILEGLDSDFFNDAAGKCRQFVADMKAGVMTGHGVTYLAGESHLCHTVNPKIPSAAVCAGGRQPKAWLHTAYLCDSPDPAPSTSKLLDYKLCNAELVQPFWPGPQWCSPGFTKRSFSGPCQMDYICQSNEDEFQDFLEDDPGTICGSPDMEIAYVQWVSNGGILHCCGTVVPSSIK